MTDSVSETHAAEFFRRGWTCFAHDPAIAKWVVRARPVAERILSDPAVRARWLRCGGTWFAGVNVFPNGQDGSVPEDDVPPLGGGVVDFVEEALGLSGFAWDAAQISVCFPGYPQPWEGELDAAFRYRRDRDAAHVDGLRRTDPGRRRSLGEVHGFILGLPMTEVGAEAAPLVVYEGSHEVMRRAFRDRFAGLASENWAAEDVTDAYVAARRECFQICPRVPVHARPGQAYLVHRLALHGVAPWAEAAGSEPRMIAYFRPDPYPGAPPDWWLERP